VNNSEQFVFGISCMCTSVRMRGDTLRMLIWFLFFAVIFAQSPSPQLVPLVSCDNDTCFFEGAWKPNGTIDISQWAYFEITLTEFMEGMLSNRAFIVELDKLNFASTIAWYIREGDIPTQDQNDVSASFYCDSSACLFTSQSISVCQLSPTKYYVGVQNLGNISASFELTFLLDNGIACPSSDSEWKWFGMIAILVYIVTPLGCLSVCCCIGCCIFCRYRNNNKRKYERIRDQSGQLPTAYQSINRDVLPHPPSSPPPQYPSVPVTYAYYPQMPPASQIYPVPPSVPAPSAPLPTDH